MTSSPERYPTTKTKITTPTHQDTLACVSNVFTPPCVLTMELLRDIIKLETQIENDVRGLTELAAAPLIDNRVRDDDDDIDSSDEGGQIEDTMAATQVQRQRAQRRLKQLKDMLAVRSNSVQHPMWLFLMHVIHKQLHIVPPSQELAIAFPHGTMGDEVSQTVAQAQSEHHQVHDQLRSRLRAVRSHMMVYHWHWLKYHLFVYHHILWANTGHLEAERKAAARVCAAAFHAAARRTHNCCQAWCSVNWRAAFIHACVTVCGVCVEQLIVTRACFQPPAAARMRLQCCRPPRMSQAAFVAHAVSWRTLQSASTLQQLY